MGNSELMTCCIAHIAAHYNESSKDPRWHNEVVSSTPPRNNHFYQTSDGTGATAWSWGLKRKM